VPTAAAAAAAGVALLLRCLRFLLKLREDLSMAPLLLLSL
jgi:hypothetical protein